MASQPSGEDSNHLAPLTSLIQAAFDDAPVGMALSSLDPNGDRTIRVANRALAEFLGTTPTALAGQTLDDLTHPDDNETHLVAATRIREGSDDVFRARKRYLHADGTYRWAELHARALHRSDGSAMTLDHIMDIADRIELEQTQTSSAAELERQVQERTAELAASDADLRVSLRQANEQQSRLELLLDASKSGIGEWNLETGELELSVSWSRMLDIDPDETDLSTIGWRNWIHPDDHPGIEALIAAVRSGDLTAFEQEYRMRRSDGSWRWNRHQGRVVEWFPDGRPRRAIGIGTDITDRRSLEAELIHAAKMQSLGALAGGIAHDFNNVLAIIQGHTEALADQRSNDSGAGNETPDRARRIESIQAALARATSLVQKMMEVSRPAADQGTTVDLTVAVAEAAATIAELMGDDVRVEVSIPSESVAVRVDEHRFQAVMLNLAANARDAMPVGGRLTIGLTVPRKGSSSVAVITVSDTGTGMEQDVLGSIFDPYFTTKAPGVGTGLGLATTYTTVSDANGSISADSAPGAGTTVTIEFPIAETRPSRPPTIEQSESPSVDTAARTTNESTADDHGIGDDHGVGDDRAGQAAAAGAILVVEDEADLLELTTEVLREHGHRVYAALDATEALETLESMSDITLLLSDVVMPGISGAELAAIVHRRWPQVATLFMSGYATTSAATERIDPQRLLTKPVSTEQLLSAVTRELNSPSTNR